MDLGLAMGSKNVDDMLSTLPDEIISHILSLMPTRFAVRTSVLSKRWKYMWMFVTNLDFDDYNRFRGKKTFSKFVNRVMKSCKSSEIQLFRMHISRRWEQNPCVSYWIYKAVMLNVRELDVFANFIRLPFSLFNCKTLTKLTLHCRDNVTPCSLSKSAWRIPCQVNLPCLNTLDILVTVTPLSDVFKLIRGCPMLENLSLEVLAYNREQEYIFDIPTLKRLKLDLCLFGNPIDRVVLDVPKLEYLYIRGEWCSTFVMEDVSSLVEASVSFLTLTKLSLFDCTPLSKLSLHHGNNTTWEFPSQSTLPCLKTLDIKLSFTPFANAIELIHSCPMLEDLSFNVSFYSREKYYVFDIPTLKRLQLIWCSGGYPNMVALDLPNLEYLHVGGELCSYFLMLDMPSLVEASISVHAIECSKKWEELLKNVSNVNSLSVEIPTTSNDPFKTPITTHVPIILNTKHLELKGYWHSRQIPQFLESFPKLEHLCIQQSRLVFLQTEECSWVEPKLVPACMLTNLTTIKIKLCRAYGCHIELLEFILGNAEALKTVTMIWQNLSMEDEEDNWFCSELFDLIPRASKCCEMYFRGINSRFTSV